MFRLLIECSKDIDKLQIDFSDGTTVVNEKPKTSAKQNSENISKQREMKKEQILSLTDYDDAVQQDIIEKPFIPDIQRNTKVAEELQNLNF